MSIFRTQSINRPENQPSHPKPLSHRTSNPHRKTPHRIHPFTLDLRHPPRPRTLQQLLHHALNELSIQLATLSHEFQVKDPPPDPELAFSQCQHLTKRGV